jgi:hypothetical protein
LHISLLIDMVAHMKTTVDIADDLLLRAKKQAEASRTTLRSLIEEGLREVLGRPAVPGRLSITPVTFRGEGLQSEFRGKGWDAVRDAIYDADSGTEAPGAVGS